VNVSRTSGPPEQPTARSIFRVVAIVVASVLALYLIYLLRTPLAWLVLATFLAAAASAPVNVLSRKMPRGGAIAIVYLGIVLIPIAVGAVLVPPVIEQTVKLVNNLPEYTQDLNEAFDENETLKQLNEDYDITTKLDDLADDLVSKLGVAAGTLADIGAGLVSSIFALVTIIVMSMFMVARGKGWREAFLATRPPPQAEAVRRATDRIASAVSGYIVGALLQALVAGIFAFAMLEILGVPSPLPLAVVIALLDLIPLVGATLGAVIVGGVTLFVDFPTTTIIWAIFAIVYQQFENYVVQPRIQSRAASLDPFLVVIAALFGGTLFGIIGALIAIPSAAAIQIAVREFLAYKRQFGNPLLSSAQPPPPPDAPGPGRTAPAGAE
jgi:predicted PurR-regulated permease PerM